MKKIIAIISLSFLLTSCFLTKTEENVDKNKKMIINNSAGVIQGQGLGGTGYSGTVSSSSVDTIQSDLYGEEGELTESGSFLVPVGNTPE